MLERRADSNDKGRVSLLERFGVCVCVVNNDTAGLGKVAETAATESVHGRRLRRIVPPSRPSSVAWPPSVLSRPPS